MSGCPMNKPSFPMPRQCPFLPPQEYRDFQQQQGPVQVQMWDGTSAWLCTRYDDVRAVLGDNRFSGDPSVPGFPSLSAARNAVLDLEPAFIRMDPPQHGHFRRMLTKEFMIKRVSAMRPKIGAIFDRLLDEVLRLQRPGLGLVVVHLVERIRHGIHGQLSGSGQWPVINSPRPRTISHLFAGHWPLATDHCSNWS